MRPGILQACKILSVLSPSTPAWVAGAQLSWAVSRTEVTGSKPGTGAQTDRPQTQAPRPTPPRLGCNDPLRTPNAVTGVPYGTPPRRRRHGASAPAAFL